MVLQDYNESLNSYNERQEKYLEERNKQNKENRQILLSKIEEAQSALDAYNDLPKDVPVEQAEFLDESLINNEIETAKTTLTALLKGQNRLYSYNIVFGKYRNFVALSSFYEYLLSGRCTSLEGPNGAYNLYESEIRANQIIAQLSEVVKSLEEIKNNQYMAYSQLQTIRGDLESLNSKMSSALSSLRRVNDSQNSIKDSLETIKDSNKAIVQNSEAILHNSEIISYNSEMAAFYARKNAELTNALGFMVAIKEKCR